MNRSNDDGCLAWIIIGAMCLCIWGGCDSAKKANDRIYELERQAQQERDQHTKRISELEAQIQRMERRH